MALSNENLWSHFVDNKTEASGSRSLLRSRGDNCLALCTLSDWTRVSLLGWCVCICLNHGPGNRYSFSSANLSLNSPPSEAELLLPGHPPGLVVSRLPGSVVQSAGCPDGPGQGAAELRPRLLWPSSAWTPTGYLMCPKAQDRLGQSSVLRQGKLRCLGEAGRETSLTAT